MLSILKRGEAPKYLKRTAPKIGTEFEMLNGFKPPQPVMEFSKKEMIVQQVIQKDASEIHLPNISAIEHRIEE